MNEADLEVQIEKLSPREGDLLVVKTDQRLTTEAYVDFVRRLEPILKSRKCKAMILQGGDDAKLLDGGALRCAARFLEGTPGPNPDRHRQTAETIRAWLIPKDEEIHDGTTDRPIPPTAAAGVETAKA